MLSTKNLIAAVDIGSNSIRLEIWRLDQGQYARVEYHKETVRMGLGLDQERNLTPDCMQRAWDCLARFGERIANFDKEHIAAAATQTLREAKNREQFLQQASKLLGAPIAVISGREEARLIYKGVANLLPKSEERRLVIDIGGRSTELILAQGAQTFMLESYRLGSASWSAKYFPDGTMTEDAFDQAQIAATAVLDEATQLYNRDKWDVAYGSSGTIGALADVFAALDQAPGPVTLKGLRQLKRTCVKAGHVNNLDLPGLKDDRRPVIGGGLSVLLALFELLDIEQMQITDGALRHGLLLELIERKGNSNDVIDVRNQTVARLQRDFSVDTAHARRVHQVAHSFFEQIYPMGNALLAQHLDWAAQLHEIGAVISHSDYHKHGAYVLDNSDAIGFALPELHRMSLLVLGHRGKLRKLELDWNDSDLIKQLMVLRLAVLLCHARRDPELANMRLACKGQAFSLPVTQAWAKKFPQSAYLLGLESVAWQKTGWTFDVNIS
jgi:exopolyphosphatase / guanosine-5'-triphosphate,3'-diphosphate pyrophosphatase